MHHVFFDISKRIPVRYIYHGKCWPTYVYQNNNNNNNNNTSTKSCWASQTLWEPGRKLGSIRDLNHSRTSRTTLHPEWQDARKESPKYLVSINVWTHKYLPRRPLGVPNTYSWGIWRILEVHFLGHWEISAPKLIHLRAVIKTRTREPFEILAGENDGILIS